MRSRPLDPGSEGLFILEFLNPDVAKLYWSAVILQYDRTGGKHLRWWPWRSDRIVGPVYLDVVMYFRSVPPDRDARFLKYPSVSV